MESINLNFHHVGVLVESTDDYLKTIPRINSFRKEIFEDEIQQAKLTLIDLTGYYIELVEPRKSSVLFRELSLKKNQIHHFCFTVEDKRSYECYRKNSLMVAGPFYSVMFDKEIEFYMRGKYIIEEIVKNF